MALQGQAGVPDSDVHALPRQVEPELVAGVERRRACGQSGDAVERGEVDGPVCFEAHEQHAASAGLAHRHGHPLLFGPDDSLCALLHFDTPQRLERLVDDVGDLRWIVRLLRLRWTGRVADCQQEAEQNDDSSGHGAGWGREWEDARWRSKFKAGTLSVVGGWLIGVGEWCNRRIATADERG